MKKGKVVATLLSDRLIVWDPAEGSRLYKMGYYGKPVGIPKPKTMEFNVPLLLDLMEGFYLYEQGKVGVVDQFTEKKVTKMRLESYAEKSVEDFKAKYKVYKSLRDKGYVVTTGIKFGCDFAVYEHGPGVDHAPYMVQVKKGLDEVTATEIVRAGRLATTVRKRFIIAIPKKGLNDVDYIMFRWWKA